VAHPKGCKTNCPACARICPQTAIIFPKYKPGGAIGGSGDIDETAEQQRQSEDLRRILSGDIYQALEKRKNMRKSIIQAEAMKKAVEDRNNALKNSILQEALLFKLPENKQV
jgi:ferredoxin